MTIHIPLILSQLKLINLQKDLFSSTKPNRLHLRFTSLPLWDVLISNKVSTLLELTYYSSWYSGSLHLCVENWTTSLILIFIAISFMMHLTFVALQPYTVLWHELCIWRSIGGLHALSTSWLSSNVKLEKPLESWISVGFFYLLEFICSFFNHLSKRTDLLYLINHVLLIISTLCIRNYCK